MLTMALGSYRMNIEREASMTNKERANKIKKLLGLRGSNNEKEYYRVADVICDLMHYCDYNKKHPTDDVKIEFEDEYDMAQTFYHSEK